MLPIELLLYNHMTQLVAVENVTQQESPKHLRIQAEQNKSYFSVDHTTSVSLQCISHTVENQYISEDAHHKLLQNKLLPLTLKNVEFRKSDVSKKRACLMHASITNPHNVLFWSEIWSIETCVKFYKYSYRIPNLINF